MQIALVKPYQKVAIIQTLAGHQYTHGKFEWLPLMQSNLFYSFFLLFPLLVKLSQPTSFLLFALFCCLHHLIETTEWVSGCVVLSWQLDQPLMSVISCACSFWCIAKIALSSNFKGLYYTTLPTPKRKDAYCKCHSDNGNLLLPWKNAPKVFQLLDCRMKIH